MTTQLVKKKFGGKRKGYKGSKWDKVKGAAYTAGSVGGSIIGWDVALQLLKTLAGGKDGGRVTKRGIGKAKRGFGKVLRKK